MFLIEMTNRAKAKINLHHPPKYFFPFVGMESISHWGRPNVRQVGCSFFGDDTDVTGLIMADTAPWYAGPFDEKSVFFLTGCLITMAARIADQKEFYARLVAELQPYTQSIDSTISRYQQDRAGWACTGHLAILRRNAASLTKKPSLHSDPIVQSTANSVVKLLAGKIVKP